MSRSTIAASSNPSPRRTVTPSLHGQAFTLVELLVVIGIIALLISILLPALGRARQQSNLLVCQTHLRQIGQIVELYVNDNQGSLPEGTWNPAGGPLAGVVNTDWSTLLLNEIESQYGTSFYNANGTGTNPGQLAYNRGIFRDVDTVDGDSPLHYSCHPRLMPGNTEVDPATLAVTPAATSPVLQPYRLSQIQRNAEIVLVMDGSQWQWSPADPTGAVDANWWGVQPVCWAIDNCRWGEFPQGTVGGVGNGQHDFLLFSNAANDDGAQMEIGTNADTANSLKWLWWGSTNGQVRFRHMQNTAANFLFCDGHVEAHYVNKNPDAAGNQTCDLMGKNVNINLH
jgi:prepilin-type processing-associated H-X9-DG protein/prepilin-type N-terminal cleavage/methylation domain-containing protein